MIEENLMTVTGAVGEQEMRYAQVVPTKDWYEMIFDGPGKLVFDLKEVVCLKKDHYADDRYRVLVSFKERENLVAEYKEEAAAEEELSKLVKALKEVE